MNIAIPVAQGVLSGVFHRSQTIDLYKVDLESKTSQFLETITNLDFSVPETVAEALVSRKVETMILGGIACKVKSFFEKKGVKVIPRIPAWETFRIAKLFADGKLPTLLL